MAAAPLRPPPVLMVDELVEEILLRVPPDDPAFLVHAALVCKHWHRLVSDPGFRRRLGQFHRTPPMLGFFYQDASTARFTPTSSFRPPVLDDGDRRNWRVVDARHGRALFDANDTIRIRDRYQYSSTRTVVVNLVVSSPITEVARRLPVLRFPDSHSSCWNAGLLCAAAGCDHLDCPSGGAFTVVLVGMFDQDRHMMALVYSSELHRWSPTTTLIKQHIQLKCRRSTLVGDALCFLFFGSDGTDGILRYDLGGEELSVVTLPSNCPASRVVLMTAEDGGLGFAMVRDLRLCTWARESSSSNGWTQHKAIDLQGLLLPDSAPSRIIALADGAGAVFIRVPGVGVFTIDLKSRRVRKVLEHL